MPRESHRNPGVPRDAVGQKIGNDIGNCRYDRGQSPGKLARTFAEMKVAKYKAANVTPNCGAVWLLGPGCSHEIAAVQFPGLTWAIIASSQLFQHLSIMMRLHKAEMINYRGLLATHVGGVVMEN